MTLFAAIDCETDPFRMGRYIRPFAWGIYDGCTYHQFWGDNSTERLIEHLASLEEPYELYAHNGGKFDWLFLLPYITGDIQLIGSRIVKASLGIHQLRDSFANMPVPLKMIGNKLSIDINKLERRHREKHRVEIGEYLKTDCTELYAAVERYRRMFGRHALTMASAAMQELRRTLKNQNLKLEKLSEMQDIDLRKFYFGGRVQCFESGNLQPDKGKRFHVYDVNSMYPAVMRDFLHPISNRFISGTGFDDRTDFAEIECEHDGCLPTRNETGGIVFQPARGIVCATGHEIREALTLGRVKIFGVRSAYRFAERVTFAEFVTKFYELRKKARDIDNDPMGALFYKLVMNSAYGKAALDPRKFTEMTVLPCGEVPDGIMKTDPRIFALPRGAERDMLSRQAWGPHASNGVYTIWSRHIQTKGRFLNVAMAASITGAARSLLMRGIHHADRPIYCDTDSIVCQGLDQPLSETELGYWKHEAVADRAAIAGKKMYALFDADCPDEKTAIKRLALYGDRQCVKLASKGVRVHAADIEVIADDISMTMLAQSPTMGLAGEQNYIHRTVRKTA